MQLNTPIVRPAASLLMKVRVMMLEHAWGIVYDARRTPAEKARAKDCIDRDDKWGEQLLMDVRRHPEFTQHLGDAELLAVVVKAFEAMTPPPVVTYGHYVSEAGRSYAIGEGRRW